MRESPAEDVIRLLAAKGAEVGYHDPYVRECEIDGQGYKNRDLSVEALEECDLAVILTDHASIDFEKVVAHASRVFDTRNATAGLSGAKARITKL
jgi:UDP-N-acetyl-D-glucosamine dehydrogenase